MAQKGIRSVLQQLQRAVLGKEEGAGDDAQLLAAFVQDGSEIALEVLMRRHGPMVMGVCHRVLQDQHDAEDAYQATFLVLARKGRSLRNAHLVGNWLYGVAYRCALHIRSANLRRRANEKQVVNMPEPAVSLESSGPDLRPVMDAELEKLPEKYRVPLVLCDLEGRQRREVARQLGLAEGTLSSRLATGRRLLAKRLSRRGLTLSGGMLAVLLAQQAQAAVPPALAQATFVAASKLAAGQAVTSLAVSGNVLEAFHGTMRGFWLTKVKIAAAGLLAAGLAAGVLGAVLSGIDPPANPQPGPAAVAQELPKNVEPAPKEEPLAKHLQSRSWTLKALNKEQRTITICDKPVGNGGLTLIIGDPKPASKFPDQKGACLEGLPLTKDAKVFIDGQPGQIADLREGMTMILKVAPAIPQIAEIQVITRTREAQYAVDQVHLKKGSLSVRVKGELVELPLAKDAKILIEMIPPGETKPQTLESPLTEIARGTPVHLQMAVEGDRLVVRLLKISQ